ncbi:MAG: hypothetical protein PHQ27_09505 [Victivallales bacterium]|nr:hypothetical protein [Victivallales bacterium]
MLNFYYITRNTFRECLREPIFFILLVTALVMIGLFPSMCLYVFREQAKLVVDSSLATTQAFGLVAAVLCAGHTISREMRNGTVLLLMSKPVYRCSFILAKICGILLALIIFVLICNCASLVALKIAKDQFWLNYRLMAWYYVLILVAVLFGGWRNFQSQRSVASNAIFSLLILIPLLAVACAFIPEAQTSTAKISKINFMKAQVLIFYSVCTMGTITAALSTRLDLVPNMTVSAVIFFLGMLSGYFLNLDSGNAFINSFTGLLYLILPNWQFFWLADALVTHQPIPVSYLLWASVNALFYMALCAIWAVVLFQNREMARDVQM